MKLLAEIDGKPVPLAECDWVLWAPCGCPTGVCVARRALTEDDALKEFWDTRREAVRRRREGYRVELMTHARWSAEVMDLMRHPCPHTENDSNGDRHDRT
jgi:hypothetical protein